jgi:hypothetical protein
MFTPRRNRISSTIGAASATSTQITRLLQSTFHLM